MQKSLIYKGGQVNKFVPGAQWAPAAAKIDVGAAALISAAVT